jgi:hypothetical protein
MSSEIPSYNKLMSEAASLLSSVFVMLLYILLFAGNILLFIILRNWGVKQQKQQQISRNLNGEPLESFLERSPFKIDHAQGDNGYRISDSQKDHEIVHFATTILDAQLWIVEQEANPD